MDLSSKKHKKAIIRLSAIMLVGIALYNGLQLTLYPIVSSKLTAGSQIKILVIADLHSHIYWPKQQPLIQKIQDQEPDLILMVGDIADDVTSHQGTVLLLEGIKNVAPIYYVTGNHEWWSEDIEGILSMMRRYGVTVLQGEVATLTHGENNIILGGVDDPTASRYTNGKIQLDNQLDSLQVDPQQGALSILLAHRPEEINRYLDRGFDLVVSGHAHGGQVQIPFLGRGLYAPNQGFFPEYTQGVTTYGQTKHIITRGLSFNWKLPRVFNPPEILLIQMKGR